MIFSAVLQFLIGPNASLKKASRQIKCLPLDAAQGNHLILYQVSQTGWQQLLAHPQERNILITLTNYLVNNDVKTADDLLYELNGLHNSKHE